MKAATVHSKLNILAIGETESMTERLLDSLREAGHILAATMKPNDDVIAIVKDNPVDAIVAYMEQTNLAFMNQIYNLNQEIPKPVIIFTEKSETELIQGAVQAGVSAFVVDGFAQGRIGHVLALAMARFNEEQSLRRELKETKSKLQERKLVEKAKGIIMSRKSLSEDDAYKALRKLAMDKNQKIAEVAKDIISVSELLG